MVGTGERCFVIAEAGVNHNGSLELGLQLVDAAAAARADAVKFQTFSAEALATRRAPKARYHTETTGAEQSWFDLLKSQELDRAKHEALMLRARERGIIFLSTPYDERSADLLAELGVPAVKIASTDANNVPFLKYVARKGRPMILSTAMCTFNEVQESVAALAADGLRELVVLQCTGEYPSPLAEANIRAMAGMARVLGVPVGYSDHTEEGISPVVAVALGACVYEVHFTLDRNLPGPDHRMSLMPAELAARVALIRSAERALGSETKAVTPSERDNRSVLRKSVVAAHDLAKGCVLQRADLAVKRPGTGLAPKHLFALVGRRLARDVAADELLAFADVEGLA